MVPCARSLVRFLELYELGEWADVIVLQSVLEEVRMPQRTSSRKGWCCSNAVPLCSSTETRQAARTTRSSERAAAPALACAGGCSMIAPVRACRNILADPRRRFVVFDNEHCAATFVPFNAFPSERARGLEGQLLL